MKTGGDTIQLRAGGTVPVTSDPGEFISLMREPLTYSGDSMPSDTPMPFSGRKKQDKCLLSPKFPSHSPNIASSFP